MTKEDWEKVDWTKNNKQLAQELGKHYDTVAHMRLKLKKPKAKSATRSDKGKPNTKRKIGAKNQPKATEQAKKSSKAGKFETNIHAISWTIVSPQGDVYSFTNLYNFIRQNSHLFADNDVMWKRTGGKRGTGGEYCNASAGLQNIKSGKTKAWKGWTLK